MLVHGRAVVFTNRKLLAATQSDQAEALLRVKVAGERSTFELPVSKADKRFFPFPFRGDELGDVHGMVSEIRVENGCKYITLRSVVQIINHFDRTIKIYRYDNRSSYILLARLHPDESLDVPIDGVYEPPHQFFFQVKKQLYFSL